MSNLLAAIPNGDLLTWIIGWRDRDTGETGKDLVTAAHAQEAIRGFEADNPSRKVTNVYQSPIKG